MMPISSLSASPLAAPAQIPSPLAASPAVSSHAEEPQPPGQGRLRKAFDQFVGETFYGQMLRAMRKTQGKPAYMHGGRTEEIFQQQLDQILAEKLTAASADQFTGPMYDLFTLSRRA